MRLKYFTAAGLCAWACHTVCAQTTKDHTMETTLSNKELVLDFWKRAIGQGNLEVAEQRIAEDYIQHSASGKPGKAALLEALALLKQMPKPENPTKPFMRVIAEGDYVVLHMLITFGGQTMIVLDMVRLHDGRFVEHWDAVQPMPAAAANAAVEGPTQIDDIAQMSTNRKLMEDYVQTVLKERRWDRIHDFVSPEIIAHDSDVLSGWTGWKEMLQRFTHDTIHRIVAEGNFVVTQSRTLQNGVPFARYDLYRLASNRIVEHWCVKQPIPPALPHNNGMF